MVLKLVEFCWVWLVWLWMVVENDGGMMLDSICVVRMWMAVVTVMIRSFVAVLIPIEFLRRLHCFVSLLCVILIWNVWGYGLVLFRWMPGLVVVLGKIGEVNGYPKWRPAYPKIVLCEWKQNWRVGGFIGHSIYGLGWVRLIWNVVLR